MLIGTSVFAQGAAGTRLDCGGEGGCHQAAKSQDGHQQLMEKSRTKVYTVYVAQIIVLSDNIYYFFVSKLNKTSFSPHTVTIFWTKWAFLCHVEFSVLNQLALERK